jgi:hypothetical protein
LSAAVVVVVMVTAVVVAVVVLDKFHVLVFVEIQLIQ